jgi:hypothetical protein
MIGRESTRSAGLVGYPLKVVRSPQALSDAERRVVAAWAADCGERVLEVVEAEAPDDDRP